MEVRLFATLRKNRDKVVQVAWQEGMNGLTLLAALGIAVEDVSVFLINGANSKPDTPLKADDIIALFPPVGGG